MGKSITENRKARFNYEIAEEIEAGVVLNGWEIKAIREGRVNLAVSYAKILWQDGKPELWLVGAHIATGEGDESRSRKLLVHKQEIDRLLGKTREKGLTLVPLSLYFKRGLVKVQLGMGKGRKKYDKREAIKAREIKRNIRSQKQARNT